MLSMMHSQSSPAMKSVSWLSDMSQPYFEHIYLYILAYLNQKPCCIEYSTNSFTLPINVQSPIKKSQFIVRQHAVKIAQVMRSTCLHAFTGHWNHDTGNCALHWFQHCVWCLNALADFELWLSEGWVWFVMQNVSGGFCFLFTNVVMYSDFFPLKLNFQYWLILLFDAEKTTYCWRQIVWSLVHL